MGLSGKISTSAVNLSGDINNKATEWGLISGTLSNQTDLQSALDSKQPLITDQNKLQVSKVSGLHAVATSGNYEDLSNKPTDMATKTWVNAQNFITNAVNNLINYFTKTEVNSLLSGKVDKVSGKGLSTNDYTTAEKTKLSGIQNGAEVNVQSDWNQTDSSADDFIKNKPNIPLLENYYNKTETDDLLDDKADKSTTYTKSEVDSAISSHHDSTKQDTLVSGTNIKTINNQSILGSGDISIQASTNYEELTNKPKINNVELSGNKSSSDLGLQSEISDLSTIRSGATLGASSIQPNDNVSELTNDVGYLTEHQSLTAYRTSAQQDIIDATKESTTNKVTSLSSSSTDTQYPSAKCVYDKLETKQDNLPQVVNDRYLHTNSSTGALEWSEVSINGFVKYNESQNLTDAQKLQVWSNTSIIKTTMDSVAVLNAQYFLGEQTSVSITMPSSANVGNEILVTFSSGATPCALTCNLQGFSFVPKANKTSWIKFTYCASDNWLVETKEG